MIAMPATKPYSTDSTEVMKQKLIPKITEAKLAMNRKYMHSFYDSVGGVTSEVIKKEIEDHISQEFMVEVQYRGEGTFTFLIMTEYEEEIYSGEVTFF